MKSTAGWDNDGNGTNTSGFAGLPGGGRIDNGCFLRIGAFGYWWSSSENNTSLAWFRPLNSHNGVAHSYASYKQDGFSVRCLRD